MKKLFKLTAAALSSLVLFTGCALSRSTTAEAISAQTLTGGTVLTENAVLETADYDYDVEVSKRDASGEYDASEVVRLAPGEDLTITEAGVYLLSGTYTDQMLVVSAGDEDKVQIVLDGVTMTNTNGPAIYVQSADKVFLTVAEGTENLLADGTDYTLADGDTELDAAVFSRDDLTINGSGKLTVEGNYKHGVVSKDDLVITATDLTVTAVNTGLRGKDSVRITGASLIVTAGTDGIRSDNSSDTDRGYISVIDSSLTVTSGKDAIQAENAFIAENAAILVTSGGGAGTTASSPKGFGPWSSSGTVSTESAKGIKAGLSIEIRGGSITVDSLDDAIHTNGSVTILSGDFSLCSGDDGIHADETVSIQGGSLDITAAEGIEGTVIRINGGEITIQASDDGINAARKSGGTTPTVEISGGTVTITMGAGDTDGIDSNGDLTITGGTISITGNSAFDYDGTVTFTGGTVIVNGQEVTTIENQFGGMGGFGGGGFGGGPGGWGGGRTDGSNGWGGDSGSHPT